MCYIFSLLHHENSPMGTRETIRFTPTVITINKHDVFACTLLHRELYNSADTYGTAQL